MFCSSISRPSIAERHRGCLRAGAFLARGMSSPSSAEGEEEVAGEMRSAGAGPPRPSGTRRASALASRFSAEPKGVEDLDQLSFVQWGHMDPFYEATVQSIEEAVLNALATAGEMVG